MRASTIPIRTRRINRLIPTTFKPPSSNYETFENIPCLHGLSLFSNAKANDFLSSEVPDELFNIGVRIGLNTSNRTFNKDFFRSWNTNSWGTGIDAGVVVNLNMRDFFALQPGFFFESRSGNYSYSQEYLNGEGKKKDFTQMGHYRTHNFTIPVMASLRFNLSGDLRWVIEAGTVSPIHV